MKINDLNWVAGCACCQPYEEAKFSVLGGSGHCIKVEQEDGSCRYMVLIGAGESQVRHMKLTEDEVCSVLSEIGAQLS